MAYASHSTEAGSMLAVWLDHQPSCSKEQRDPDGWANGVARTDFLVKRLAELAKAPNVEIIWQHGAAAEWWSRIDTNRRRSASRAKNISSKEEGRNEAARRAYARGR